MLFFIIIFLSFIILYFLLHKKLNWAQIEAQQIKSEKEKKNVWAEYP